MVNDIELDFNLGIFVYSELISKLFKLFFLVFVSLWGFRGGLKIRVALVTIASIIIHLRYRILR